MSGRTLGLIKPTERPGSRSAENLIRLLPAEVTVRQTHLDIRRGTREELEQALLDYEAKIAAMVAEGADLIHPAGVPLLLLGYDGERQLVRSWEEKYGRPVFTNGMSQVNALRAFAAQRIVGASYFPGAINEDFGRYIRGAGFDLLDIEGMEVAFDRVLELDTESIRSFIRGIFRRHSGVDAIYLVGSAWPTLQMLESLEAEFGVPVVHHIACQCWEIQKRFGLRRTAHGYGRLLAELP